jgi:hypothetical protein
MAHCVISRQRSKWSLSGVQRQSLKRQTKLDRELEALDEGGDPVEGSSTPRATGSGGDGAFLSIPDSRGAPPNVF